MKAISAVAVLAFLLPGIALADGHGNFVDAGAIERQERQYIVHQPSSDEARALADKAAQGDAASQFWMGYITGNGLGVQKDLDAALAWYRKAAAQGYTPAYYKIGYYYMAGWSVQPDADMAEQWYRKGIDAGDPFGKLGMGQIYTGCTAFCAKLEEGRRLLGEAADAGIGEAASELAIIYHQGLGVKEDPAQAFHWYEKAAETGDNWAQFNVGAYYRDGYGVAKDYAKALEWFNKSAAQGNPRAAASIAALYDEGKGVEKDPKKALDWHIKSAQTGQREEQFNTGSAYYFARGVEKDVNAAAVWWEKAAKQGDALSENNIGVSYLLGIGKPQDYFMSYMWMYASVAQGFDHARERRDVAASHLNAMQISIAKGMALQYINTCPKTSQAEFLDKWVFGKPHPINPDVPLTSAERDAVKAFRLGNVYYEGDTVQKNDTTAVTWWRLAASMKVVAAEFAMGRAYENGDGVKKDYVQAASWYKQAAEQNDGDAQKHLGMLYENGQGVEKDAVQAYMWYTLANDKYGDDAILNRNELAKTMSADDIRRGEDLAQQRRKDLPPP